MKEGSGIRTTRKPWTMDDIRARSTEEGNCLLWAGATTPTGFPYAYMGSEKVNLRPYVFTALMGKTLRAKYVVSVRCGNRACLSEHCLVGKTISQVRRDVHKAHRRDPISHAKTRNGVKAAGLTKLDMAKAAQIRESGKTSKQLAGDYGVSVRTIQEIRAGATYAPIRIVNSIFNLASTL